jgi:hypothetical protein
MLQMKPFTSVEKIRGYIRANVDRAWNGGLPFLHLSTGQRSDHATRRCKPRHPYTSVRDPGFIARGCPRVASDDEAVWGMPGSGVHHRLDTLIDAGEERLFLARANLRMSRISDMGFSCAPRG